MIDTKYLTQRVLPSPHTAALRAISHTITLASTIAIDRLASSSQRGYAWVPDATARTLTVGYANDGASSVTIQVKANATAAEVASAINASTSAPVVAAVDRLSEELARRCALAVDNARLYGERSHVARTLQGSLVPAQIPPLRRDVLGPGGDVRRSVNRPSSITPLDLSFDRREPVPRW